MSGKGSAGTRGGSWSEWARDYTVSRPPGPGPRAKLPIPEPKRPPIPSPLRIHSALLLVSLLFGVNFVLVKEVLAAVEPRAWALFRLGSATLVLLPLVFVRRTDGRRRWPPARLYGWLTLAALLGVFLNQSLFTVGMKYTTPDHSAVINTSIPVIVDANLQIIRW